MAWNSALRTGLLATALVGMGMLIQPEVAPPPHLAPPAPKDFGRWDPATGRVFPEPAPPPRLAPSEFLNDPPSLWSPDFLWDDSSPLLQTPLGTPVPSGQRMPSWPERSRHEEQGLPLGDQG